MPGVQIGDDTGGDRVIGFLEGFDLGFKDKLQVFRWRWGKDSTSFQRGMVYGILNFHVNNIIELIWSQCMEIMGRQIWGQYKQELSDGRSFAKVG